MIASLHTQAQSICFKIQCDQYLQTAAKDATGERAAGLQSMASTLTGQGITVSNIVDYMSLIEQRSVQVSYTICTREVQFRRSVCTSTKSGATESGGEYGDQHPSRSQRRRELCIGL